MYYIGRVLSCGTLDMSLVSINVSIYHYAYIIVVQLPVSPEWSSGLQPSALGTGQIAAQGLVNPAAY